MEKLRQYGRNLKSTTGVIGAILFLPIGLAIIALSYILDFFLHPRMLVIIAWLTLYQACEINEHSKSTALQTFYIEQTLVKASDILDRIEMHTNR